MVTFQPSFLAASAAPLVGTWLLIEAWLAEMMMTDLPFARAADVGDDVGVAALEVDLVAAWALASATDESCAATVPVSPPLLELFEDVLLELHATAMAMAASTMAARVKLRTWDCDRMELLVRGSAGHPTPYDAGDGVRPSKCCLVGTE